VLCKKIKKCGGAEQHYANEKYTEAVAVAAEACTEDTKGQTCYICTQALHWKTKEGLVRRCACRGTSGFAHVSCLAEQAKILVAEAEENNLGDKVLNERWARWDSCGICKQQHHGIVACALGWACWSTYVGRPERDWTRRLAMTQLGNGLWEAKRSADALSVYEAELSMLWRLGDSEGNILATQSNLANTYHSLGRLEQALEVERDVYTGRLKLFGEEYENTLISANNYAIYLNKAKRFEETKSVLRKMVPVARRVLGEPHELTLSMKKVYAQMLYNDTSATLDDLREAVTRLEDAERIAQRVLGRAHPDTAEIENSLRESRAALQLRLEVCLEDMSL
jgi:tetratricopeptide (TPR) repeat protein